MRFGFKIGIADVSGPDIQIIELSQEDKESDSMKGDNTRVDAIKQDFSKVSVGDQSALVASVMFHIKDKVNTNLPVTTGGLLPLPKSLKVLYLWSWDISRAVESCHLVFPLCLSSLTAWL